MAQQLDVSIWKEFETERNKLSQATTEINLVGSKINLGKLFKVFLEERLPGGAINSVWEKNFALYAIQNGINLDDIKAIYRTQGWRVGGLMGYVKMIREGKLTQVNPLELLKWCRQYKRDDIAEMIEIELAVNTERADVNSILKTKDLLFPTDHLKYFFYVNQLSQLHGKKYMPVLKCMWYQFVSLAVPIQLRIIERGDVYTDWRFQALYIMPSGKGKLNAKTALKKVAYVLGKKTAEPRSSHPEQWVGKVVKRKIDKEDQWIKNPGYLSNDLIISEEAYTEITGKDPQKEDTRNHQLVAMDDYGRNEIAKKSVDNLDVEEERLAYLSPSIFAKFTQPRIIGEEYVESGGYRRLIKPYVDISGKTDDAVFIAKLKSKTNVEDALQNLKSFLKNISEITGTWSFSEEFDDTILLYHRQLVAQGLLWGGKRKNYTFIMEFPLLNFLIKMACLQAISDLTTKVTADHVRRAYIDLAEFYSLDLDFLQEKVMGEFDYGATYKGANQQEIIFIQFLQEKKALSKETAMKSADLLQAMANISGKSVRQANRYLDSLLEKGIITTMQSGSGKDRTSSSWLIIPMNDMNVMNDIFPSPKNTYLETVKTIFNPQESGKDVKHVNHEGDNNLLLPQPNMAKMSNMSFMKEDHGN